MVLCNSSDVISARATAAAVMSRALAYNRKCARLRRLHARLIWLRTNGVNTNGTAAKVMNFDRLGKKGTPWHFWEDKSRLTGVPKKSLCQNLHEICSDPIRADPICPFPEGFGNPGSGFVRKREGVGPGGRGWTRAGGAPRRSLKTREGNPATSTQKPQESSFQKLSGNETTPARAQPM